MVSFPRNEPENCDKAKTKKIWLFPKKKASICTSQNSVKSPDAPMLSDHIIKQLKILVEFLEKDESKRISIQINSLRVTFPFSPQTCARKEYSESRGLFHASRS